MGDIESRSLLSQPVPYVTLACLLVCTVVCAAFRLVPEESFPTWGLFAHEVLGTGGVWVFITHSFVHADLVVFAVTMFWLYFLGSALEREFGSWYAAIFVSFASFVSCGFAFLSGQFVFGFSGINAAMVGFGLVARRYHPNLQATFCNRTIQAYCAWFAIGFCTTLLYITNISSVAHFTGAIFGVVCGFAFVKLSVPAKIGLSLLTLASAIPLVWCPLSYEWNISKGYHLIQHREYSESLPYILQAQRLAPDVAADTYVLECLVSCHAHLRQKDEYNRTIDLFRIKDKARAQVYEKKYGYPFGVFN